MSLKIDQKHLDNPEKLTEEERQYLQDRGRLPAGVEPVGDIPRPVEGRPLEEVPHTGDVNTVPDDTPKPLGPREYHGSTNRQLQDEIRRRNVENGTKMSLSGNRAELIERLEDDDSDVDMDDEDSGDED